MVDELLVNNIVRESNSPYASPALLVNKKNGEKRLCIDYRALNKITVKDKYPMPRIEDLVDRLQSYKVFTSLDLKSGYYQIAMHRDSIEKTAFITEDGHFEFLRLPFGLANASSCFQQMMNKTLESLKSMGADTTDDRWDQCIKALQQGLNSTIHKTTRAVPSEVMFGYRLRMDSDSLAPELEDEKLVDMSQLRERVDSNVKASAQYQKERFDKSRVKAKTYKEGDLVLIRIQSQSNDGQSRKLMPTFKGPFQVKKILNNDRYEVVDLRGSQRCSKMYNGVAVAENMKSWINIGDWSLD
ncbi:uncharacterized protein LOC120625970 [Pararge aegeria]|uniref:uncharacterized protein LOC120625970 n=1 Tax=Pararge aegeria TaxID=116150 RepID=UPI0019D257E1|nr:uncharacterized protein LOC120625970 [Pararge aegeria]